MATNLVKDSKVSDESVFILDTVLEDAFIVSEDQREDAFSYYRAKVAKSDKGRIPETRAFVAWVNAGMPKVNSDAIRMERLAVSEGSGRPWSELTEDQYDEYRKNWEAAGSPEPEAFLPRGTRAKIIGYVLDNGMQTEDERTIYITSKVLDEYREENGITGPSGFDTYLASAESEWKGEIVPHTLRTNNRTVKLVNGKPVTKSEALKEEIKAAIAAAAASGDMEALQRLAAKL